MTNIQVIPNELSDKRVLVTGGTKGMGEAIVKRLRQAGATVMTTARSSPDELQSPELFIQSDISTSDGVEKVVKEVLARLGGGRRILRDRAHDGGGWGFFRAKRRRTCS